MQQRVFRLFTRKPLIPFADYRQAYIRMHNGRTIFVDNSGHLLLRPDASDCGLAASKAGSYSLIEGMINESRVKHAMRPEFIN